MKKTKLLFSAAFIAIIITSCNKETASIKRVYFNDTTYEKAKEIHTKMKEEQEKKFLEKATCTIKYSMKATGKIRIDKVSFHNLDLSASAGYVVSWSIKDNYLKIEGEKEVIYYKKMDDNKWWEFQDYTSGGGHYAYKIDHSEDKLCDDFKTFVTDTINDYTCLVVPSILYVGIGITGENSYAQSLILGGKTFEPDDLFDTKTNKFFTDLKTKYETANEGYSSSVTYGSDDNATVYGLIKGKYKAADLYDEVDNRKKGAVNLDLFASYRNNFISQGEFIASGNVQTEQMNNFNVDFNVHLSEDVKQDECAIDTIDPSKYTKY